MGLASNFGMNNFQYVNNNMDKINFNGFNNPMLNQYNQINPILNQMKTVYQGNPMPNIMGNYNQNNQILNPMNNYNQNNQMLSQMNNYNQNNPILNQMEIYNQSNPIFIHINNYNQNNQILNQINNYNQGNQMLNQKNNYNQSNPILNQMNTYNQNNQMNQIISRTMMTQRMNQNMNQKNEINQEKRIKEKKMSQNSNNLNENQMGLINSIIQFYKENDNEYMDFGNPNQIKNMINFLSLNYNKLDISDNIEDPLYYIVEPKKIIKFINSDNKQYKVNIPLSITKYDLYSIAQNYKCFKNNKKHLSGNHSNILLIYNNLILNRDETSINCINNNDIIIIIEPRNFPDDSFYNSLQERAEDKGCIQFEFSSGKSAIYRTFPYDIKICEIYKSIILELGLDINTYKLKYNEKPLEKNDQREGTFLLGFTIIIYEYNIFKKKILFGKIVIAKINRIGSKSIGILNSVNDLKELILNELKYHINKKIKNLKIENNVIEEGDFRSLLSLGITNDFTCFVEYEK